MRLLLICSMLILLPIHAFAQSMTGIHIDDVVKAMLEHPDQLDKNHDNQLSADEVRAALKEIDPLNGAAPAEGTIQGKVLDQKSAPVKGAFIKVTDLGITTETDNEGNYRLSHVPLFTANHQIEIFKSGFTTEHINGIGVFSRGLITVPAVTLKVPAGSMTVPEVTSLTSTGSLVTVELAVPNSGILKLPNGWEAAWDYAFTPEAAPAAEDLHFAEEVGSVTLVNEPGHAVFSLSFNRDIQDGDKLSIGDLIADAEGHALIPVTYAYQNGLWTVSPNTEGNETVTFDEVPPLVHQWPNFSGTILEPDGYSYAQLGISLKNEQNKYLTAPSFDGEDVPGSFSSPSIVWLPVFVSPYKGEDGAYGWHSSTSGSYLQGSYTATIGLRKQDGTVEPKATYSFYLDNVPTVQVKETTVPKNAANSLHAMVDEPSTLYLVPSRLPQYNSESLLEAINPALKKVYSTQATDSVALDVTGLPAGSYQLYAVDSAGNVSWPATYTPAPPYTNIITITETDGQVAGSYKDAITGAALADADVNLTVNGITTSTKTSVNGEFAFADVPTGEAVIDVAKTGYRNAKQTGVHVSAGPNTVQLTTVSDAELTSEADMIKAMQSSVQDFNVSLAGFYTGRLTKQSEAGMAPLFISTEGSDETAIVRNLSELQAALNNDHVSTIDMLASIIEIFNQLQFPPRTVKLVSGSAKTLEVQGYSGTTPHVSLANVTMSPDAVGPELAASTDTVMRGVEGVSVKMNKQGWVYIVPASANVTDWTSLMNVMSSDDYINRRSMVTYLDAGQINQFTPIITGDLPVGDYRIIGLDVSNNMSQEQLPLVITPNTIPANFISISATSVHPGDTMQVKVDKQARLYLVPQSVTGATYEEALASNTRSNYVWANADQSVNFLVYPQEMPGNYYLYAIETLGGNISHSEVIEIHYTLSQAANFIRTTDSSNLSKEILSDLGVQRVNEVLMASYRTEIASKRAAELYPLSDTDLATAVQTIIDQVNTGS